MAQYITADELRRACHHVFLPPQLPQASDEQSDCVLVTITRNALHALLKHLPRTSEKTYHDIVKRALNTVSQLENVNSLQGGNVDAQALLKALKTLKHGDTFATRISAQNAAVLISRSGDQVTFEQFELSPLNEHVMGCQGRLIRKFPGSAVKLPSSHLAESDFASTIAETLATMSIQSVPGMQPRTARTGSHHVEQRNTSDCAMISDFFMAFLRAYGVPVSIPVILKKTREDVLWQDAEMPWRRSSMWLLIRVSLQLVICRATGGSRELYKEIMIYIMSDMLRLSQGVDDDLLYAMVMKIERRRKKIEGVTSLPTQVSTNILANLAQTSNTLSCHWEATQVADCRDPNLAALAALDFGRDAWVSLPSLEDHIASLHTRSTCARPASFTPVSALLHFDLETWPELTERDFKDENYTAANLCAFEAWVAHDLESWLQYDLAGFDLCTELHDLMKKYHRFAIQSRYNGNAESVSLMTLTLYELWVACDQVAVGHEPCLADYDPEIPTAPLQSLLLPHLEQMQRLQAIEQYIHRRSQATLPAASLFDIKLTHGFPCRYYDKSAVHQALCAEIKADAALRVQSKLEEFRLLKAEYAALDATCQGLEHYIVERTDVDPESQAAIITEVHLRNVCERCRLETQRNEMEISIFEDPLPWNTNEEKSVVFELALPVWFGHWRDARLFLLSDVLHGGSKPVQLPKKTYALSQDDPHLRHWSGSGSSHRVALLSESKPSYNGTHYTTKRIAGLQENEIFVRNGLKYNYFDFVTQSYTMTPTIDDKSAKSFTYTLGYRGLQRFITRGATQSDGPPPNLAIASQQQCPSDMTLEEYRDLCTLPLGHHVQWTNLLLQLEMPSIDFKKLDTSLFVLQMIHQVGPPGDATKEPLRESHHTLLDDAFADELVSALFGALDRVKANWESAQALRTFVAIATRVSSLRSASAVHDRCLHFLAVARTASLLWLDQLLDAAHTTTDPILHSDFMTRSFEIALICTSTCDVDDADLSKMTEDSVIAAALMFCSTIVYNGRDYKFSGAGQQYRLLQARLKRVLARACRTLVRNHKALNAAVQKSWADYEPSSTGWTVVDGTPDWVCTTTASHMTLPARVHFNCLTGALLINGAPLSQPPKEIIESAIYRKLFGSIALEVVPSSSPNFQYSAKLAIAGHRIRLGKPSGRFGDVTVQIYGGGMIWETVPSRVFEGIFPTHFVQDFVQWYNVHTGVVKFQHTSDLFFLKDVINWNLSMDPKGPLWCLTRRGCAVLPLAAATSRQVAHVLEPLAPISRIHNIVDTTRLLHVEIPSLRLNFELRPQSSLLTSKEHPHTAVDADQSVGVFIGLRNKIVLAPLRGGFRVLLLGEVGNVPYCLDDGHVAIDIPTSLITRVHAVQIDDHLGRLIDNGDMDCKLYLAQLHALTSGCLPEPLTHVTGTEAALNALDRADVKSFTQLSQAQAHRLAAIARLSPSHEYYPRHKALMQQVHWDAELSYLAQHARFRDAVQVLLDIAKQANFFYPDSQIIVPQLSSTNEILVLRAAVRSAAFRISGFGAEDHASSEDQHYASRDTGARAARMVNVTIITALFARLTLRSHWESLPSGHLWQSLMAFPLVNGRAAKFDAQSLKYTATLMETGSKTMLENFPAVHTWLSNATQYNAHKASTAMWAATMAFEEGADLHLMQTIALGCLPIVSAPITVPEAQSFQPEQGRDFDSATLSSIVAKQRVRFSATSEDHLTKGNKETEPQYKARRMTEWLKNGDAATALLTPALIARWSNRDTPMPDLRLCKAEKYLHLDKVMIDVNAKYKMWQDNKSLYHFLRQIERASTVPHQEVNVLTFPAAVVEPCESVCGYTSETDLFNRPAPHMPVMRRSIETLLSVTGTSSERDTADTTSSMRLSKLLERLESAAGSSRYEQDYISRLQQSASSLGQRQVLQANIQAPTLPALSTYLMSCKEDVEAAYATLLSAVSYSEASAQPLALQWPRICPIFFLRQLARDRWRPLDERWKKAIVTYGVALTAFQQAGRMLKFAQQSQDADVISELRNPGHTNWAPSQFPETLLMEIESGLLVREVQHDIAEEMRTPQSAQNSVMQLNMGEGKSTVITPMVAASNADGERLSRVFVAKPQSKQMAQMLLPKVGGLTNHRVYYMPFSRSLNISFDAAEALANMLEECREGGGILLLQPEHILSFRLMALQCCIDGREKIGQSIMRTLNFLDECSRDLVDEADENFSVRFELIYTVGTQEKIHLDRERWLLIQEVLRLARVVAEHVAIVLPSTIEVYDVPGGSFPRIRILHADGEQLFQSKLAEAVCDNGISGLCIPRQSKQIQKAVYTYISKSELTHAEISALERSPFWDESTKPRLLLLHGLIARGLLAFCMGAKRWRVNYGLATRLPPTRLAVPYRAKDSPTPRSEFSHPDVIIILTSLTYYYQGLSEVDMFDAISHLLASNQANAEYEHWVRDSQGLDPAFRNLQGVNVKDERQCIDRLFPALRFGKSVIDFFLAHVVFPKEMREFPYKLSASGWDIGKKRTKLTTGFSGTNDSRPLLPFDVMQLDLDEQSHTNAKVLDQLLRPGNTVQLIPRATHMLSDTRQILDAVQCQAKPVHVILDVGAQIIELNNLQLALTWLERHDLSKSGAIFVNDNDDLCVVDRDGCVELLQTSSFSSRLDECLVFLDEAHTRGIDLKLPSHYRAAVTLGAGVTKDRLVQACNRMRKLDDGQSIVFCVSEEIRDKILAMRTDVDPIQSPARITIEDILAWSINETHIEVCRTIPLWAVQGERFVRQQRIGQAARKNGNTSLTKSRAAKYQEEEARTIESRYQPTATHELPSYLRPGDDLELARITERCKEFEGLQFSSSSLQEEQERELSPENEAVRQVQRAATATARAHALHPDILSFALTGRISQHSQAASPAFASLRGITPAKEFNVGALDRGTRQVLVSKDFANAVTLKGKQGPGLRTDVFHRSVQWFLTKCFENTDIVDQIVIISPYEANLLYPQMRHSTGAALHVYKACANSAYRTLDDFRLYTIPGSLRKSVIPRALAVRINVFAGQLYIRSYEDYREVCAFLGVCSAKLTQEMCKQGWRVHPDGFIASDDDGRIGGKSGLKKSPVRFVRTLLSRIRRNGDGIAKTHMGRFLGGDLLQPEDFPVKPVPAVLQLQDEEATESLASSDTTLVEGGDSW